MLLDLLISTVQNDFWHDTLVQFVGIAIITIVSGALCSAVTYWIYIKQRLKKLVAFHTLYDASVTSVSSEIEDRIQVQYDGKQVNGLRILYIKVENAGNTTVKPEDYVEPIVFHFDRNSLLSAEIIDIESKDPIRLKDINSILTLEQVDAEPEDDIYDDLPVMTSKASEIHFDYLNDKTKDVSQQNTNSSTFNSIKLAPFLLKPGEAIVLKIMYEGKNINYYYAGSRIVDGDLIRLVVPPTLGVAKIRYYVSSILLCLLFFVICALIGETYSFTLLFI